MLLYGGLIPDTLLCSRLRRSQEGRYRVEGALRAPSTRYLPSCYSKAAQGIYVVARINALCTFITRHPPFCYSKAAQGIYVVARINALCTFITRHLPSIVRRSRAMARSERGRPLSIRHSSCKGIFSRRGLQVRVMTQSNILVVGSLNMDQVVRVPRIPALGETLLGAGSLKLVPGGKGANQAVAMARLGATVTMAGRVGTDPFGAQLVSALQADTIDTHLVVVDQEEASGVAFIFLTPNGDNSIVVASGANMRVGKDQEQFARIIEAMHDASALVMQLEIPLDTVKNLIAAAHAARVPTILNLAPAQSLPQETLRQVSVLILNESEASLLTGQHRYLAQGLL